MTGSQLIVLSARLGPVANLQIQQYVRYQVIHFSLLTTTNNFQPGYPNNVKNTTQNQQNSPSPFYIYLLNASTSIPISLNSYARDSPFGLTLKLST